MEISVLDVGAASFDLLRARLEQGEIVERHCFTRFVRLGEGTLLSSVIAPDAWNAALTAIEALLACAQPSRPEQLVTVATSVLREARNGPAFGKTLHVL
jgi:exopolyphosphatase/pppGpp-phosphohydrolase